MNMFKNAENEDKHNGKMRVYICEPRQDAKPVFFRSEDATFDNEKKALDRHSTTPVKIMKLAFTHIWGVLLCCCFFKNLSLIHI